MIIRIHYSALAGITTLLERNEVLREYRIDPNRKFKCVETATIKEYFIFEQADHDILPIQKEEEDD